jgi:tape measure domain-containing protein
MQIFDLFGDVRLEGADNVNSTLDSIGSALTSAGASIMVFGSALYKGVTEPLADMAMQGIKYNATIEDLQTAFGVLLGSETKAADMMGKIREISRTTPFETEQLAQAAETFLAYGMAQEKVLPTLTKLGDVAMGNSEHFKVLTYNMAQISAAGKLQAVDLRSLVLAGWNPLKTIMETTGESMDEVKARMKDGKISYEEVEKALDKVTSAGGRFYQGMEKGSKTFNGQMSTLKDTINEVLANATKPFFDFLKDKAIPFLIELSMAFDKLDPSIKNTIVVILALIAGIAPLMIAFGAIVMVIGGVISSLGVIATVFSAIGIVIPIIVGVLTTLIGVFGLLLLSSSDLRNGISTTFSDIGVKVQEAAGFIKKHIGDIKDAFIGLIQLATTGDWTTFQEAMKKMVPPEMMTQIQDIIGKFIEFRNNIISVRDSIIEFATNVITFLTPIKDMIINTFSSIDFTPMKDSLNALMPAIQLVLPLFEAIGAVLGGVIALNLGVVIGLWNGLMSTISFVIAMFLNFVGIVTSVMGLIVGIVTLNTDLISSSFNSLIENIKGYFINGLSIVVSFVSGFISGIITFFGSLYTTITGNQMPALISGIQNWFSQLPGRIYGIISGFVDGVVGWFAQLPGRITSAISGVISSAVGIFNSLRDQVLGVVSSLVSSASSHFSTLKGAISTVASAFDSIISAVNSVISAISRINFPSMPSWLSKIPGFADGITNFGGGLAMVGERGPELVYLPKGSNVYDNNSTNKMLSGNISSMTPDGQSKESININTLNLQIDMNNMQNINDLMSFINNWKSESIARGVI